MQPVCRPSVPVQWLVLFHSSENLQTAFFKFDINYVTVGREVNLSTLLDGKKNLSSPFLWRREVSQETGACEITAPKLTCENS